MGGQGRKTIITYNSPKRYRRCQEPDFPTEERLSFVQPLSLVASSSTAPLVGEPLAKPFTLRGLPRPPLGRGGGTASAVTERLSPAAAHGQAPSSYNLSVSLRSTRPGCGSQHPPRSACVLLAAAPTAPPCFRHWRRSSPLPLVGEPLAKPFTLRGHAGEVIFPTSSVNLWKMHE